MLMARLHGLLFLRQRKGLSERAKKDPFPYIQTMELLYQGRARGNEESRFEYNTVFVVDTPEVILKTSILMKALPFFSHS